MDSYEKYDPFLMKRDGCENARQMEYFFGKGGYVSFPDLLKWDGAGPPCSL